MFVNWRSHFDYQTFLLSSLKDIYKTNPTIVEYYSASIEKLYILNLDDIKPLVSDRYSLTGKPSNQQPERISFLNKWNIKAVISLNPKGEGKNKYEPPIGYTKDGIPICKCNQPMVYDWYDKGRSRIKYRCPLVKKKISKCPCREECSPSTYGRVV